MKRVPFGTVALGVSRLGFGCAPVMGRVGRREVLLFRRSDCLAHQSYGLLEPVVEAREFSVLRDGLLKRRGFVRGQFAEQQRSETRFELLAWGLGKI